MSLLSRLRRFFGLTPREPPSRDAPPRFPREPLPPRTPRSSDGGPLEFWWENWPDDHGYELSEAQRVRMRETFSYAWDDGVRDPDSFFRALRTLGYTVLSSDWDEWREWYDEQ